METANDIAVRSRNTGLVDVLDRVLEKGVVVDGDIELCVAGIQLVYLKLKMLLSSTATIEKFASPLNEITAGCSDGGFNPEPKVRGCDLAQNYSENCQKGPNSVKQPVPVAKNHENTERLEAHILRDDEPIPCIDKKPNELIDIDPKKVEQGLAKLVLTLVELLRKLMEKQALRRVELGTLTDKQVDSLGEAFMSLNEKVNELKKVFGLKDEDLNLDLGPVGDLI